MLPGVKLRTPIWSGNGMTMPSDVSSQGVNCATAAEAPV